jgi:hypothetical protein
LFAAVRRSRARGIAAAVCLCALAIGVAAAYGSHRILTSTEAPGAATAINLRHSDLPKLGQQSNPITKQEQQLNDELATCIGGVPNSTAFAEAQSPTFAAAGASTLTISSSTEILPSAALVAQDLAAITGAKGIPCLESQLRSQLQSSVAKGQTLTVKAAHLRPLVSGTDGTFALRFTLAIKVKQGSAMVQVAIYYDVIGFAYGQAEVGLDVLTSGAKPSTVLEKRLVTSLLKRARAAIG